MLPTEKGRLVERLNAKITSCLLPIRKRFSGQRRGELGRAGVLKAHLESRPRVLRHLIVHADANSPRQRGVGAFEARSKRTGGLPGRHEQGTADACIDVGCRKGRNRGGQLALEDDVELVQISIADAASRAASSGPIQRSPPDEIGHHATQHGIAEWSRAGAKSRNVVKRRQPDQHACVAVDSSVIESG